MFQKFACLLVVLVSFALPAAALAEPGISLDAYIEKTMTHSPQAAVTMAEIQGIEANATEAEQRNNPTLQADITSFRSGTGRELEVELEQPLRGSDFGSRTKYARAIRATKNAEQKAKLLALSHDATRAYTDLWLAQEKLALVGRLTTDARRQIKIVNSSVANGTGDSAEAKILSTEIAELELQKSSLSAERRTLLNAFIRLAGLAASEYQLATPPARELPNADLLIKLASNEASARALLAGRRGIAERRLATAQADAALPEITPRAVLRKDFSNDSDSVLVGVRVALPIWSRNEAEVIRAKADYESTSSALRALEENNFPIVLKNAWQAAKDNEKIARQYRTAIVPGWREVEKLTESRLGVGQASIFDLWQARTKVFDSETKGLEARRSSVESVLTLENLTGIAFNGTAMKGD
ncbi:MAG: TolC family protein [Micavibrio sp.]|nr:TolC family protein [Micavibrio sp.]